MVEVLSRIEVASINEVQQMLAAKRRIEHIAELRGPKLNAQKGTNSGQRF